MPHNTRRKWEDWSKEDLKREILDRMRYFYLLTNGNMRWPSNAEGDILKMVYILLNKEDG